MSKLGRKIKAKWDDKCEKCGKSWKETEEIYWDADKTSATCSDLECYKSKGGSTIEFPKGGGGGGSKSYGPQPRSVEDMMNISANFLNTVMPNALKFYEENAKIHAIPIEKWVKTVQEVYMDKFDLNKNIVPGDTK